MLGVDGEPVAGDTKAPLGVEGLDVGPVQPTDDVRAELVALLEADESRLGQVYRRARSTGQRKSSASFSDGVM
jgi:hypothetical protein